MMEIFKDNKLSYIYDNEFWNIYNKERSKSSYLPDADEDFIALEKALFIYQTVTGMKV